MSNHVTVARQTWGWRARRSLPRRACAALSISSALFGCAPTAPAGVPGTPTASVSAAPSTAPAAAASPLDRTCAALAAKNQPGKVPAAEQEDPDAQQRALDAEDLEWDSVGKCQRGEGGAWVLDVVSGARLLGVDTAMIRLNVALVHLSDDGQRSETSLEIVSPYVAGISPKPSFRVAGVMDLTEGPEAEIALCVDSVGQEYRGPEVYVQHPLTQCRIYAWLGAEADAASGGAASIALVETPGIARFVDADKDGRLDLITSDAYPYPGRPGYCSLRDAVCPEGLTETGPQLLYHSVPDGFDPADAVAKQYAKRLCPTAPSAKSFMVSSTPSAENLTNLMQQMGCGLLWNVPPEDLESWLSAAEEQMCDTPGTCEEFMALRGWMTQEPLLDLSAP